MQTFARKLSVIVSLVILATSGGTVSGCAKLKSKLKKETQFKQTSGIPAAPVTEASPLCAEGDCATIPFTRRITSAALFDLYASDSDQLGAFGKSVKFFIDARKSDAVQIYFINANYRVGDKTPRSAIMHYDFAQVYLQIPEGQLDYNQVTYFTNDKRYYAGAIQRYRLQASGEEIYGVQFFPQDVAAEAAIQRTVELVANAFAIDQAKMAFVATGVQQTTASVAASIDAKGFRLLTIEDILSDLNYLPMNNGEAWGYLRLFPSSQDDLLPTDIAVFDELPLDLAVVAGVITKAYQDPNSHVNLKSRERRTPNMVLRQAAADTAELAPYLNKPVHLTVARDRFTIELSSDAEVQAKFQERASRPWIAASWLRDDRLLAFDEMCPDEPADCLALRHRFGAKAANLGFLAHPYVLGRASHVGSVSSQYGYDLSPHGLGVPLGFYERMVNDPANLALKNAIASFVEKEKAGSLTPAQRRSLAAALRDEFLQAKIPEELIAAVQARLSELMPGVDKIKIRSSASAEDLAGFNGAGLYDSFKARTTAVEDSSQCVVVTKVNKKGALRSRVTPDTVACAIKATYASLWNTRAIDERTYARMDHVGIAMGLAIVPAYNLDAKISANSVLVTRIPNTGPLAGYSISSFKGNNLVTNPAPKTWSEMAIAVLLTDDTPTSFTMTRFAKSKADKVEASGPLLERPNMLAMVQIAKMTEEAYCRAVPAYYPPAMLNQTCEAAVWDRNKPKALDFEIKHLANGRLLFKQVREFAGGP